MYVCIDVTPSWDAAGPFILVVYEDPIRGKAPMVFAATQTLAGLEHEIITHMDKLNTPTTPALAELCQLAKDSILKLQQIEASANHDPNETHDHD